MAGKRTEITIGTKHISKQGVEWEILDYRSAPKKILVDVCSSNGTLQTVEYGNLRKGNLKDPLHPSVFGVGIFGIGPYTCIPEGGSKNDKTPNYIAWKSMLERVYSDYYLAKQPTYRGCSISEYFLNFQNFSEWFLPHYSEGYVLDKDLKIFGNKVYSEDTCLVVPKAINGLIVLNDARRGEYPVGVHWAKHRRKFVVQVQLGKGRSQNVGARETLQEAFDLYCQRKLDRTLEVIETESQEHISGIVMNAVIARLRAQAEEFNLVFHL